MYARSEKAETKKDRGAGSIGSREQSGGCRRALCVCVLCVSDLYVYSMFLSLSRMNHSARRSAKLLMRRSRTFHARPVRPACWCMKNSSRPREGADAWNEREGEERGEEAEGEARRGVRARRVHRGRLADEAASAAELQAARADVEAAAEESKMEGAVARRSACEAARCIIAGGSEGAFKSEGTVSRGRGKRKKA